MERSVKNKANSVYVGKEGKCLRIVNSDGLVCMGFRAAEKFKSLGEPKLVSIVGEPKINNFNGNQYPQFMIEGEYLIKSK